MFLRAVSTWGLLLSAFYLSAQAPTFNTHIADIIYQHCSPCHREGQIGPMPLSNYQDISAYASMIAYVTRAGYMPPWKANPSYSHFANERVLTAKEVDLIQQWVEAGAPEGAAAEQKSAPDFPNGPQMQAPDLRLSMAESFEQFGIYYDKYQVFVIPTNLLEDKEISAIEFVPGNPKIVRYCSIAVDTSDRMESLDQWDPAYGYYSFGGWGFVPGESDWYNWSTGQGISQFPKGFGKRLPKNARLLLHIHYGPTGIPLRDSSYLNLQFAKQPVKQLIQSIPLVNQYTLSNPPFVIPAGERTRFHARFKIPFDIELTAIKPHSLLLAKSWEVFAKIPGVPEPLKLIKIDDWDFKWKASYQYPKSISLKKGTEIHAIAAYDNTEQNPYNPSLPPTEMSWGKRMFQELFLVHFSFYPKEDIKDKPFELLPAFSHQSTDKITFDFRNKKTAAFTCRIMDFEGNAVLPIIEQQLYTPGQHRLEANLSDLPKGNYYIELSSDSAAYISRRIFVYFDDEGL